MSVQPIATECPKCGAIPGEQCIGARGQLRDALHRARHMAALDAAHQLDRAMDYARAIEWERKLFIEAEGLVERLAQISIEGPGSLSLENLLGALEVAVKRRLPALSRSLPRLKDKIGRSLAKAVMERDAYRCVSCGTHVDLSCDHIVPESKGGPTTLDNLQTMCRPCNSKKGARVE